VFTGVWQSAVILVTFAAFYAVDTWLMRRYDPMRAQGSSRAWSYTIVVLLVAVFLVLQPFLWPGLGISTGAWWGLALQVVGLLLILGALVLQVWARIHLGQFFGEREEIQPGQYLVKSGPYAHVRHPLYTSYFLYAVGLLLVNPSLPMVLAAIYAFVDFPLAMRREEKLLRASLPGYSEYMASIPGFLPRLRRRSGGG
jgi:protein-S-isoprenylcysteine O-methyltransferase Ste14